LTKAILAVIAVAVLMGLLSWPVKYVCPNGPCSTAPDAEGYIHRYYEVQPLGVVLVENILGKNFALVYSEGVEKGRR
jgi:hypothetical protein